MSRIAIGDLQGCLKELKTLLKKCAFSSDCDELWFVGDLVNRGPESLGVLRFIRALGANAKIVLGNHDLHLLALAYSENSLKKRHEDTLQDIFSAPDRDSLLDWLRQQPLVHYDLKHGELMVHAGVVPQWSKEKILQLAAEVATELRERPRELLAGLHGNKPDQWHDALQGLERFRLVINALTRLRYCHTDGLIDFEEKGMPGTQAPGLYPWFEIPHRKSSDLRLVFGHWSSLGLLERTNLLGLDTGCVWGGALTAYCLDDSQCWQV